MFLKRLHRRKGKGKRHTYWALVESVRTAKGSRHRDTVAASHGLNMIWAMISILHPWQIVVIALAGWINRQQLEVIEYLKEENRVLREQLKGNTDPI